MAQIATPFVPVNGGLNEPFRAGLYSWSFGGGNNPSARAASWNRTYHIDRLGNPVSLVKRPGVLPLLPEGLAAPLMLRLR